MSRWIAPKMVLGVLCGFATMVAGASNADAFYGSWGSSGGSYGSHGSSGGSWGSSGGSYGSWGSHGSSGGSWGSHGSSGGRWYPGKLIARWHAHKHASHGSYGSYGSHGSSGGSWGSSGGSYGSWGSHGSSGGSYGVHYHDGGYPVEHGTMSPESAPITPSPSDSTSTKSAVLNVNVPTAAKVYVNGLPTTSTGAQRRFVSNGLEPGFNYTYEVRAEMVVDGEPVVETKTVRLQAGQNAELAFSFSGSESDRVAQEPVRTVLTVRVPSDAKVYLSGNATRSTGEVREFATTRLLKGEQWDNYTVRVEFEVAGKTVSREETITLAAGEHRELNFDNEAAQVARNDR